MTPEIDALFLRIKQAHGENSISRVEQMVRAGGGQRHPLQQGAKWILPGISPTPWHEPYAYPEIAPVAKAFESNHAAIKAELEQAWQASRDGFHDYQHYLSVQQDWQALYLYRQAALVEESARLAPTAFAVLRDRAVATETICPLLESHFSVLLPGAHIKPHCDLWNFSINLHVAIDVPEGCAITVAGETRNWHEGECLLFDYSFEHEAWNDGDRPRTCLLVDLWHPETTRPEREALTGLITEVRRLMG
jgi:aspartyl/asparaginyl beta-hydroxylase (cupin superfamily)